MKTNKNHLQQGDVILKRVEITLEGGKKITDKRGIVLAEGEATGHYHGIECEESEAELIAMGEKILLNVLGESVTLKHQEHNPITIQKGVWEVGQVIEKDWLSGMTRKVVD